MLSSRDMTEIDLLWRLHPFQGLVGAVPGTRPPGGLAFGASGAGQIADKAPPSTVPAFSSFVFHFLPAIVVAVWCPSTSGYRLSVVERNGARRRPAGCRAGFMGLPKYFPFGPLACV